MPDSSVEERIRRYLIEELGVTGEVSIEDRLIDRDFVASAELIDVVVFIEDAFGVVLRPVDVVPENMESIATIAKVVRERLADAVK